MNQRFFICGYQSLLPATYAACRLVQISLFVLLYQPVCPLFLFVRSQGSLLLSAFSFITRYVSFFLILVLLYLLYLIYAWEQIFAYFPALFSWELQTSYHSTLKIQHTNFSTMFVLHQLFHAPIRYFVLAGANFCMRPAASTHSLYAFI